MLKIKDTVALEELEKFGFKYDTFDREYKKHITANEFSDYCYIDKKTRKIKIDDGIDYYNIDEWNESLFDLIQAGLVEQVENVKE